MVEGGTLSEKSFAEWGKKFVLFCHITTQIAGEKHGDLLSEKGGNGFPYFIFMDPEGKILSKLGGDRSVAGFDASAMEALSNLAQLADLGAKSAGGDVAAKKDYFLLRLGLGHLDYNGAKAAYDELTLTEDEQKTFGALLVDLEVGAILQVTEDNKESREAAGAKFKVMAKAGKIPADSGFTWWFWNLAMDSAAAEKDAEFFEQALGKLRELAGSNPKAKAFIAEKEALLNEMKAGAPKKD